MSDKEELNYYSVILEKDESSVLAKLFKPGFVFSPDPDGDQLAPDFFAKVFDNDFTSLPLSSAALAAIAKYVELNLEEIKNTNIGDILGLAWYLLNQKQIEKQIIRRWGFSTSTEFSSGAFFRPTDEANLKEIHSQESISNFIWRHLINEGNQVSLRIHPKEDTAQYPHVIITPDNINNLIVNPSHPEEVIGFWHGNNGEKEQAFFSSARQVSAWDEPICREEVLMKGLRRLEKPDDPECKTVISECDVKPAGGFNCQLFSYDSKTGLFTLRFYFVLDDKDPRKIDDLAHPQVQIDMKVKNTPDGFVFIDEEKFNDGSIEEAISSQSAPEFAKAIAAKFIKTESMALKTAFTNLLQLFPFMEFHTLKARFNKDVATIFDVEGPEGQAAWIAEAKGILNQMLDEGKALTETQQEFLEGPDEYIPFMPKPKTREDEKRTRLEKHIFRSTKLIKHKPLTIREYYLMKQLQILEGIEPEPQLIPIYPDALMGKRNASRIYQQASIAEADLKAMNKFYRRTVSTTLREAGINDLDEEINLLMILSRYLPNHSPKTKSISNVYPRTNTPEVVLGRLIKQMTPASQRKLAYRNDATSDRQEIPTQCKQTVHIINKGTDKFILIDLDGYEIGFWIRDGKLMDPSVLKKLPARYSGIPTELLLQDRGLDLNRPTHLTKKQIKNIYQRLRDDILKTTNSIPEAVFNFLFREGD